MGLRIIQGDIIEAEEPLIIHQVNCQDVMGSGVARALYEKWPEVKKSYHEFCSKIPIEDRLGSCDVAIGGDKYVINAFSQFTFGTSGQHTDYSAVRNCFLLAKVLMHHVGIDTIAIPYNYGCGLGGGDWSVIEGLIEEIFGDSAVCYRL